MVFPRLVRGCSLAVLIFSSFLLLGATETSAQTAGAGAKKPNIVVIFGDDVGYWNISAYNQGMMGYKTPHIDRIAHDGALFTDYYAQQSCTAGRAAFITGQSPIRTGLTKVGLPGADLGIQKEDPTLADLLKTQGYLTFQHGKNHLGDRNEFLPTVHGFDEFYGNLYHLNAEEEPENVDYPKTPVCLAPSSDRVAFMIQEKGFYGAGMTELYDNVGVILKKIQDLGIGYNTIVIFSSDNGAETFSWPDGGTTPFRGEKSTSWEGGYRVPFLIRWPGTIKPGTIINDIGAHEDWVPTLMAAVGDPGIKEKLLKGFPADGMTYKVHLDGYDWSPYFKGDTPQGPRKEFLYWTDDGDLAGLRYNKWKLLFLVQRAHGFDVWQEPFTPLRVPMLVGLHADPFEQAEDEAADYSHWRIDRVYLLVPAQAYVGQWLQSFREFPPRQKPASFSLDQVMQQISRPQNGDN